MARELEIESKVLLNDSDFYALFDLLGLSNEHQSEQINYYFDTESRILARRDIFMRVRLNVLSKIYTLTVKIPQKIGKLEINEQLTSQQFEELSATGIMPNGEIATFIGEIPEKLILLTSLTTIRCEINYEGGRLALDHNFYNGLQDFELEFEGQSEKHCQYVISELMERADINFDFNTVSKRSRAFRSAKLKKKKQHNNK